MIKNAITTVMILAAAQGSSAFAMCTASDAKASALVSSFDVNVTAQQVTTTAFTAVVQSKNGRCVGDARFPSSSTPNIETKAGGKTAIAPNPKCTGTPVSLKVALAAGEKDAAGVSTFIGRIPLYAPSQSGTGNDNINYDYMIYVNPNGSLNKLCTAIVTGTFSDGFSSIWDRNPSLNAALRAAASTPPPFDSQF